MPRNILSEKNLRRLFSFQAHKAKTILLHEQAEGFLTIRVCFEAIITAKVTKSPCGTFLWLCSALLTVKLSIFKVENFGPLVIL